MTNSRHSSTPARSQRLAKIIAFTLFGFVVVSVLLLTTQLGVWVFSDLLGSLDEEPIPLNPAAGPLASANFVGPISGIEMPPQIEQPSGIAFDSRARHWVVSTDQAELFVLDELMSRVLSRRVVLKRPPYFRQGRLEAVAFLAGDRPSDDRLALTGEIGSIEIWRRQPGGSTSQWIRDSSLPLDPALADIEASALAFDPAAGELFIASSESSVLTVVDRQGSVLRRMDLDSTELWPPGAIKAGRQVDELWLSGLSFSQGKLWAVSENYTTLFQLDPRSGRVLELWSLPELGEASDLALLEGSATFTLDHNWDDPRPTFRRIEVPGAILQLAVR